MFTYSLPKENSSSPMANSPSPPAKDFSSAAPYPPEDRYPPDETSPYPPMASSVPPYQQPTGFAPPPPRGQSNPAMWILGCLGGGCLLIVLLAVAIALILPAVQVVRDRARENAGLGNGQNLLEAREGQTTQLTRQQKEGTPVPRAPRNLFDTVQYNSDVGPLSAYVGVDPGDGKKHPAMIWLFGGFSNGIGQGAWIRQRPSNDQSASSYRQSGVIMMYPSRRGGNDNPGHIECFWGEVNDVIAAAEYLASLPYVDPDRIYLGGHSTGGTLALLCAASTDRFRATIALGPVHDVSGYGQSSLPFDAKDTQELKFRNPMNWVRSINHRTFIIEGESGNARSVQILKLKTANMANINCLTVPGHNHFSVISPVNRVLAEKIKLDTSEECNLELTIGELTNAGQ